jgi:hypothetical protein
MGIEPTPAQIGVLGQHLVAVSGQIPLTANSRQGSQR